MTVPVPKFQLKVEPAANGPGAEIVAPTFKQPEAGAEMVEIGGEITETAADAGAEEHPPEVTIKLAEGDDTADQLTDTGPALVDVDGVAPTPKLQL
jgi:hypothetical protein